MPDHTRHGGAALREEKPHRRRRWPFVLALLLATVAALSMIAARLVRPWLEHAASAALGRAVRIDRLAVGQLATGEIDLRGVALGEPPLLGVASIAIRPAWRALLERQVVIERIAIDGLDATVEQDASGRPALRGLPFPPAGDDDAGGPAITVREIALTRATVALVPPPTLHRTPVTLAIEELLLRQVPTTDSGPSWEGELSGTLDGVPLTARARADRVTGGTRITADADLTGAEIDARRLVLPPGFASLTARASGHIAYELDPERKRDRVTADLDIAQVKLSGDQGTSLAAARIQVQGVTIDLASGQANLGRIAVDGPRIEAVLGPSGLVYPGLVPALVESGVSPSAKPAPASARSPEGPAWRVTAGRIDASAGHVALRRDAHRLALDVPSFTWREIASGKLGNLALALRAADGGTIEVDGRLGIDPAAIDVTVRLAGVDLPSLSALADPPLVLARGTASGTIAVHGSAAAPEIDARLDVSSLHSTPPSPEKSDRVLAVDRLEAQVGVAPGPSGEVHVSSLRLSYPYAMIARDAHGIFPLDVLARQQPVVTQQPDDMPPASGDAPRDSPAPRTIRIDTLTIDGGRIDFVDHTTTPPYWMGLASVAGSVAGVSLEPGALGHLELRARQDELHPLAAAARHAGATRWHGSASLQGLSLPTLNPYLAPVLGYEAQTGTLSVTLTGTLDGSKLGATSAFTLDDVGMRQTGLDVIQRETGVPLTVALGLLEDVGGEIELEVPVEVDTRTGEYALGSFVTQAIGRAVLGALSSPLRWLGMLFGTDGPPHALAIDPVPFVAGGATLDEGGATRVGQIARILQSHADLDVILKAQIAASDRAAVGEDALVDLARRRVEAVRSAFASGRDGMPILPARLIVAPWTPSPSGALDAAPAVYVEVQAR